MKISTQLLGLLCLFSAHQAIASQPKSIPPDLVFLETMGSKRVLAYRVCSPEHCWNLLHLQQLTESNPPRIKCSVPLHEINDTSDMIIQAARMKSENSFSLTFTSSHGGFESFTTTIFVTTDCKYRMVPVSPRSS